MAAKKTGRKTLLDDDKMERICTALRAGCYIDEAAGAAGVTGTTYHNWMNRGRTERDRRAAGLPEDEHESIFVDFLESVEKAQAEAAVDHLKNIAAHAADGSWQASAWILERKFPRKWGRMDRTEHTGPEGGPVRVDVSTEDLERKVQRILETRDAQ